LQTSFSIYYVKKGLNIYIKIGKRVKLIKEINYLRVKNKALFQVSVQGCERLRR